MPTQNIILNFRPDVANFIWRSLSAPFKKFLDGWEITALGASINPENSNEQNIRLFKHDLLKLMNEHKRVPDEVLHPANSDKWGEIISIRYYFYNVPNNRIPRFITQFKKQFDIYYRKDLLTDSSESEAIGGEWECEWVVGERTQYDFPSDHHPDKFCCRPEETMRINTTDRSVFPPSITISRAPSLGYDAYPFVKNDSDEPEATLADTTVNGFRTFCDILEKGYSATQENENKVIDFYDSCMVNGLDPEYWGEGEDCGSIEYLYPDCADYSINKYMSDNDIKDWLDFKTQFAKDRVSESC